MCTCFSVQNIAGPKNLCCRPGPLPVTGCGMGVAMQSELTLSSINDGDTHTEKEVVSGPHSIPHIHYLQVEHLVPFQHSVWQYLHSQLCPSLAWGEAHTPTTIPLSIQTALITAVQPEVDVLQCTALLVQIRNVIHLRNKYIKYNCGWGQSADVSWLPERWC